MQNEKMERACQILVDMAGDALLKKIDRLRNKRFVLFPLLRIRLLLRKYNRVKALSA